MFRALAFALFFAPSAHAKTIVLDFEEEVPGVYEDGFVSSECGCAQLRETSQRELGIGASDRDGSNVLFVGEEGGSLLLTFLVPVIGVSLDFGGDSWQESVEVHPAVLMGFVEGELVATSSLERRIATGS